MSAIALVWLQVIPLASASPLDLAPVWRDWHRLPQHWDPLRSPWLQGEAHLPQSELQASLVRLPPGRTLRIQDTAQRECLPQTRLLGSNGSGLYRDLTAQCDRSQANLLYTNHSAEPLLIRVLWPRRRTQGLSLWLSRLPEDVQNSLQLKAVELSGPGLLTRSRNAVLQHFHLLGPAQPRSLEIEGPNRLEITTRLTSPPVSSRPARLAARTGLSCQASPWGALNSATLLPSALERYELEVSLTPLGRQWPEHGLRPACQHQSACGSEQRSYQSRLQFTTTPELLNGLSVGLCPILSGREETRYLDIPPGRHGVQLFSARDVLLRVRKIDPHAWLVPSLNAPQHDALALLQHQQSDQLSDSPNALASRWQRAQQWLHNNQLRDGALLAIQLLRDMPHGQAGGEQAHRLANELEARQTYFRAIAPRIESRATQRYFARTLMPTLQPLAQARTTLQVHPEQLDSLLQGLTALEFVQFPLQCSGPQCDADIGDSQLAPIEWALTSQRQAESAIRLILDTRRLSRSVTLWLQYDDQPAQRLHVYPQAELPDHARRINRHEAGLRLLNHQRSGTKPAMAWTTDTSEVIDAAHIQLPLPTHVKTVRLWSPGIAAAHLGIVLQQRLAKPYELSTEDYLDRLSNWPQAQALDLLLQGLPENPQQPFWAAGSPAQSEQPQWQQLKQHWIPTLRLLQDRRQQFLNHIGPSPPPGKAGDIEAARIAMNEEDALHSLQRLGDPRAQTRPAQRQAAYALQHRALLAQGERHIATTQLRGILRDDPEPSLRSWALQTLLDVLDASGDSLSQQYALAAALTDSALPQNAIAARLVRQWVDSGQHKPALWLGLLLPACERPDAALLQAAFMSRQWPLFHQILASTTQAIATRWQGLYLQAIGAYDEALTLWQNGDTQHHKWAVELQQAMHINRDLDASDPAIRQRALRHALQLAQTSTASPRVWSDVPPHHIKSAGQVDLHSVSRELLSTSNLATRQQPLELTIQGPTALRLLMRPLLPSIGTERSGWIHLEINGEHRVIPFFGNRSSPGIELASDHGLHPGQAEISQFNLPAGVHSIRLHAGDTDLLVEAQTLKPMVGLSTLAAAPAQLAARAWHGRVQPVSLSQRHSATQPLQLVSNCRSQTLPALPNAHTPTLTLPEINACTRCTQTAPADVPEIRAPVALDAPDPAREAPLRQRLIRNIYHAEHSDDVAQAQKLILSAVALGDPQPRVAEYNDIFGRIRPWLSWRPQDTVTRSAGFYLQTLHGWQPISDHLRLRQRMLPETGRDEFVLRPGERLHWTINRMAPSTISLFARKLELAYALEADASIQLSIDGQPYGRISNWQGTQQKNLEISAGKHQISLHFDAGYANQFIAVRLAGLRGAPDIQRRWQVSLQDEPLVIHQAGPSLLRIQPQDGAPDYAYLADGNKRLIIHPRHGRSRQHIRIERLQINPRPLEPPPIRIAAPLNIPPRPRIQAPQAQAIKPTISGSVGAGRGSSGTWSLRLGVQNGATDSQDAEPVAADYQETRLQWRLHAEPGDWHFAADAYNRVFFDPFSSQWLRLGGQRRIGSGAWQISAEQLLGYQKVFSETWSARWRVGLRQRWLFGDNHGGEIRGDYFERYIHQGNERRYFDPELYSAYKRDHPRGWRLGYRHSWKTWQDQIWHAELLAGSNADLRRGGLDYMRSQAGFRQLLGPFDLGLNARWQHSFADRHRPFAQNDWRWSGDIQMQLWPDHDWNLALQLRASYDTRLDDTGIYASIRLSLAPGRQYRDWTAGEIPFANARLLKLMNHSPADQTHAR